MGTLKLNQYLFSTRWASLSPWVGWTLAAAWRLAMLVAPSAIAALAKVPARQAGASAKDQWAWYLTCVLIFIYIVGSWNIFLIFILWCFLGICVHFFPRAHPQVPDTIRDLISQHFQSASFWLVFAWPMRSVWYKIILIGSCNSITLFWAAFSLLSWSSSHPVWMNMTQNLKAPLPWEFSIHLRARFFGVGSAFAAGPRFGAAFSPSGADFACALAFGCLAADFADCPVLGLELLGATVLPEQVWDCGGIDVKQLQSCIFVPNETLPPTWEF